MTSALTRPDLDCDVVADVLARHADNPSAFLALNAETRHFTVPGVDGVIAYQPAGRRTLVQFGGVFSGQAARAELLTAFLDFARSSRRKVVAVQLLREDADLYAAHGFTVNQFGADYARATAGFTLAGKKHMQLRNKVSRAQRAGVSVAEADSSQLGSLGSLSSLDSQLDEIDRAWLHAKGRHVKELKLMVGERGGPAQTRRRLFVATDDAGTAVGYVSFSPVYGKQAGWLHDLSRRSPDAPPGVLELIVVTAVKAFQAEQVPYFHFGFTPFTSLSPEHEVAGASRLVARVLRFLGAHGAAVYPAASQLAYKEKWAPDLVQPEYIAFQGGISLRRLWDLLRVTNSLLYPGLLTWLSPGHLVGRGQVTAGGHGVGVSLAQQSLEVGDHALHHQDGIRRPPRLRVDVPQHAAHFRGVRVSPAQRPLAVGDGALQHRDGFRQPPCRPTGNDQLVEGRQRVDMGLAKDPLAIGERPLAQRDGLRRPPRSLVSVRQRVSGSDRIRMSLALHFHASSEDALIERDGLSEPPGLLEACGQVTAGAYGVGVGLAALPLPDSQVALVKRNGLSEPPCTVVGGGEIVTAGQGVRVGVSQHPLAVGEDGLEHWNGLSEPPGLQVSVGRVDTGGEGLGRGPARCVVHYSVLSDWGLGPVHQAV
jgi:hypothetical protein